MRRRLIAISTFAFIAAVSFAATAFQPAVAAGPPRICPRNTQECPGCTGGIICWKKNLPCPECAPF